MPILYAPFVVMVDRRQWILEFDEDAVGITQLVRRLVEVVVGVVAHQVSE